ncbi:MAG TPA: glycosyltransferase family 2 protein [Acetobacteraceae bacterium]|nr:glycosyltransferase family 2 protein [Acetobacteraceae bacterium]
MTGRVHTSEVTTRLHADQSGWVCIVIPAYNEAATIGDIVHRCRAALDFPCMIIVVDDGSRDRTGAIAAQSGATVLRHAENQGKGASLMNGMRVAFAEGAACVVSLDGDGQHRPEDIPRLLACGQNWPRHVVIGSRRASGRTAPRARFIANRVADFWVSWAARHPIDDSQSGFRVYPAELVGLISARPAFARGFAFESEMLIEAARLGFHTASVDIPTIYGSVLQRPSHFRPIADITWIVLLVAGKLLAWGMDPVGLWRSLTLPRLCDNSRPLGTTPCRR